MLDGSTAEHLAERFPTLKTRAETWHRLLQSGSAARVPQAAHICTEGDNCSHLALLLDG